MADANHAQEDTPPTAATESFGGLAIFIFGVTAALLASIVLLFGGTSLAAIIVSLLCVVAVWLWRM